MTEQVFPAESRGNGDEWVSVSDLMAGLMMVFMAIAIFFMVMVRDEQEGVERISEVYQETRGDLYEELYREFKEDLPKWNAELDETTLSFIFREPDVLFDQGSSELKDRFKLILDDFFPRYVAILFDGRFKENIDEIRIEGHTSSEWQLESSADEAYFLNMALSQSRTRTVLEYVFSLPAMVGHRNSLKEQFTANGLSSSKTVKIRDTDLEDHEASRRVEFRVRTNAEERMAEFADQVDTIKERRAKK